MYFVLYKKNKNKITFRKINQLRKKQLKKIAGENNNNNNNNNKKKNAMNAV